MTPWMCCAYSVELAYLIVVYQSVRLTQVCLGILGFRLPLLASEKLASLIVRPLPHTVHQDIFTNL
jgi:hypothetical protein